MNQPGGLRAPQHFKRSKKCTSDLRCVHNAPMMIDMDARNTTPNACHCFFGPTLVDVVEGTTYRFPVRYGSHACRPGTTPDVCFTPTPCDDFLAVLLGN